MKHILSKVLIVSLVFGSVLTFSPFVVQAQTSTLAGEQAYKLIKEAESSMSLIDMKLGEIQQLGALPINSGVVMQVSLGEISGKLEVSKDLLDRALVAYQSEDYTTAAILAFRSKQNSILTSLYLEGLMSKASAGLGVSRLELQGTFADLLRLRGLLQPVTTTIEPGPTNTDNDNSDQDNSSDSSGENENSPDNNNNNPTDNTGGGTGNNDSNPPSDSSNNPGGTTTDTGLGGSSTTTNQIPQATSTSSTTTDNVPPVVPQDPRVLTCIEKNIVACKTQESTCISKVKNLVNGCQAKFDKGTAVCKRYETRSNTYLVKCQSNLSTCLGSNIAAKNIRCQTKFNLCQISAKISQDRDLNTAKTCLAKQVTQKTSCDNAFDKRTSTLLSRCTATYTTCDNKVKTKCIASVKTKVKAVTKPN